ncbi:Uma2 family endonuclease [Cohnella suwonensis]|uniref:Uma2 family endonuclease n=1 Tax=Cohnella suwonensis TaxID=696072 RepID=A0ABW0LQF7_9BACL
MSKKKKDEERIKEQLAGYETVTYDMYAAMPDDGKRYEIFDGKLEMMSGPNTIHQSVSGEMQFVLKQTCNSDYMIFVAPLDVIFSKKDVVQPDVMLVHVSRMDIVKKRGIEGAPDLLAEIISPGSRKKDKIKKLQLYARYLVPEYWIVDLDARTIERHVLKGEMYELEDLFEGDDQVVSDKLPCVSFLVSDLFKGTGIQRLLSSN